MSSSLICCACDTRIEDEPEDISEFVSVARGTHACQACAADIVHDAHLSIYDDDPDGYGPCRCSRCMRSRATADAIRKAAYVAAVGGLSVEGIRLLGGKSWIERDGQ